MDTFVLSVCLIVLGMIVVQLYQQYTIYSIESFDSLRTDPDWRERNIIRKNQKTLKYWNLKDTLLNAMGDKFSTLNSKINTGMSSVPEGVYI